jgi:hypothetical protein
MGGFSSSVQAPQTGQSQGGKFSNQIASVAQQTGLSNRPDGLVANPMGLQSVRPDGLDQNAINADPQGFQSFELKRNQQDASQGPGSYGGNSMPQPMGKGGRQTNSATSGQPRMGMQNQYSNTVGQWDNSQIQALPAKSGGKGKGG